MSIKAKEVIWSKKCEFNLKPITKDWNEKAVTVMEIGVFKGYGTLWMLKNILQHQESRYYGIDPFDFRYTSRKQFPDIDEGRQRWNDNLKWLDGIHDDNKPKIEWIKGFSQDVLIAPEWQKKKNVFDLIYVDGHHTIISVLRDFVLTWPLLKIGGIMVFDDYIQRTTKQVKTAVDVILTGLGERRLKSNPTASLSPKPERYLLARGTPRGAKYETILDNFQYGIRKLAD